MQNEIPVTQSKPGKYRLTKQDKEYIKSFAKEGTVSFEDYIVAVNKVLNGRAPHKL